MSVYRGRCSIELFTRLLQTLSSSSARITCRPCLAISLNAVCLSLANSLSRCSLSFGILANGSLHLEHMRGVSSSTLAEGSAYEGQIYRV